MKLIKAGANLLKAAFNIIYFFRNVITMLVFVFAFTRRIIERDVIKR